MKEVQVRSLDQEDPLENEMVNPLQSSCLGNPMDRGDRQAIDHGVAKESDITECLNNNIVYAHLCIDKPSSFLLQASSLDSPDGCYVSNLLWNLSRAVQELA